GSDSATYSMSSPSSEPSPKCSSKTSARYDVPSTTCVIPTARMRESTWDRNGTPAVGNIGLGADSVSGRNRVPLPPTRITASTPDTDAISRGPLPHHFIDANTNRTQPSTVGCQRAYPRHQRRRPRAERAIGDGYGGTRTW